MMWTRRAMKCSTPLTRRAVVQQRTVPSFVLRLGLVRVESSACGSSLSPGERRRISTAASCRRHSGDQDAQGGNDSTDPTDSSRRRAASPRRRPAKAPSSSVVVQEDSRYASAATDGAVVDNDHPPQASPARPGRPMTMQERFRQFPLGVAALYLDCLRYKNIHDASRTRLNAWTLDPPYPRQTPRLPASSTEFVVTATARRADRILRQDSFVPGRVPRRQHEQQRQLVEDLYVVLPLVVAWLPPIIGYLPMILSVLAPRQVLTRQFWNDFEVELYAREESIQRRHFFSRVAELFWNATTHHRREPPLAVLGLDAAGPVVDPRPLFAGLDGNEISRRHRNPYACFLQSVEALPDEYLVPLALASGSFASVGGGKRGRNDDFLLPRLLAGWCAPRRFLRHRVRRNARAIAADDALLIEEGAHVNHCQDLTDLEVMDACLLRGLPLSNNGPDMRTSLSNHLAMMALVHLEASRQDTERQRGTKHRYTETFGLLSLHLSILRASLCRSCAQERAIRPPSNQKVLE